MFCSVKCFRLCKCVQNTKKCNRTLKTKSLWSKKLCVCKKQIHHLGVLTSNRCIWSFPLMLISSSKKVFWSESGEKSAQIKHRLQAKTVQNSSKQICGWVLMQETTGDGLFHWRKCYYGLRTILAMQLFSSLDVNWWTGVVCIIVVFLSAVWTLILTAPIHCRASITETLMQWHISPNLMKKQTHLDGLTVSKCSANFIFGSTIPLKRRSYLQTKIEILKPYANKMLLWNI